MFKLAEMLNENVAEQLFATKIKEAKVEIEDALAQTEAFLISIENQYTEVDAQTCTIWMESYHAIEDMLQEAVESGLPGIAKFVQQAYKKLDEMGERWAKRQYLMPATAKETAEKYDRHVSTIYRWLKAGKLPAKKEAGRWVVMINARLVGRPQDK